MSELSLTPPVIVILCACVSDDAEAKSEAAEAKVVAATLTPLSALHHYEEAQAQADETELKATEARHSALAMKLTHALEFVPSQAVEHYVHDMFRIQQLKQPAWAQRTTDAHTAQMLSSISAAAMLGPQMAPRPPDDKSAPKSAGSGAGGAVPRPGPSSRNTRRRGSLADIEDLALRSYSVYTDPLLGDIRYLRVPPVKPGQKVRLRSKGRCGVR